MVVELRVLLVLVAALLELRVLVVGLVSGLPEVGAVGWSVAILIINRCRFERGSSVAPKP